MQRKLWLGVGTLVLGGLCGCSSDDPAPGSEVGKASGGSGGAGGAAGSLSLGISGGGMAGGGAGGGGAGGAAGSAQAGTGTGGTTGVAGSSSGGSGGTKLEGMCKRAPGSDAACSEFAEMSSQAHACDDRAAYRKLNTAHGNQCINTSGVVPGAAVEACCPP